MKRLIIQSVRKLQAGEPVTLGDTTGGTNRDVMQEKLHTMFEPPQPVSDSWNLFYNGLLRPCSVDSMDGGTTNVPILGPMELVWFIITELFMDWKSDFY